MYWSRLRARHPNTPQRSCSPNSPRCCTRRCRTFAHGDSSDAPAVYPPHVDARDRFDEFRRRVLADAALQERLRSIPDWPAFVVAAVEMAGTLGLDADQSTTSARRRESATRAWLARWVLIDGWVPIRVHERTPPVVEWCWLDGAGVRRSVLRPDRRARAPHAVQPPLPAARRRSTCSTSSSPGSSRAGSCFTARAAARRSSRRCSAPCRGTSSSRSRRRSTRSAARRARSRPGALAARDRLRARPSARGEERAYVLKLDAWSTCSLGTRARGVPGRAMGLPLPRAGARCSPRTSASAARTWCPARSTPHCSASSPGGRARSRPRSTAPASSPRSTVLRSSTATSARCSSTTRELPGAVSDRILAAFGLECDDDRARRMDEVAALRREEPVAFFRDPRRRCPGVARAA